jgi:NAD(P)-dependent dehydrogenase (short-subunit alcohol dehydrogenase family)
MQRLAGKTAVVVGGSRGFGEGIVRALAAEGAAVWALGRDAERLAALKQLVAGVQTLRADVTEANTAPETLRAARPDILVLNAGATPTMAPVHQQSWEEFARTWETDVRMTFAFGKEALLQPLAPGSTVIILSSGAAIGGSPLSGAYAGAKRMQWLLAQYLQGESDALKRGIRFVALLPNQISPATELGSAAVAAYSAAQGLSEEAFLARWGAPLLPEHIGSAVVALLTEPEYQQGLVFRATSQGVAAFEGQAAVPA